MGSHVRRQVTLTNANSSRLRQKLTAGVRSRSRYLRVDSHVTSYTQMQKCVIITRQQEVQNITNDLVFSHAVRVATRMRTPASVRPIRNEADGVGATREGPVVSYRRGGLTQYPTHITTTRADLLRKRQTPHEGGIVNIQGFHDEWCVFLFLLSAVPGHTLASQNHTGCRSRPRTHLFIL